MPSRSRTDLLRWAAELISAWGFKQESGFHVLDWSHDDLCPLQPDRRVPYPWSRCECEPDGTLVLHVGTTNERRIEVVRDGIPLPVFPRVRRSEPCATGSPVGDERRRQGRRRDFGAPGAREGSGYRYG